MVEAVDQDDAEDDFIDAEAYFTKQDIQAEDDFIDAEEYFQEQKERQESKQELSWPETVGDWLTQAGRGALKAFTWPADVIKLAMIGQGLSDIDEIEEAHQKQNIPFDREQYVGKVFETAKYIPTQELLEKSFEDLTGISLEPKTAGGKRIKQASELASLVKGGITKKLATAATGVATTEALKQSGVGEEKAEVLGDVAAFSPKSLEKVAAQVPKQAKNLEKIALKNALPFKEFMVKERAPVIKGRLFKNTEARLKESFDLSAQQALGKIVENELPILRLRNKGVDLDAFGEYAYEQTRKMAQKKPRVFTMDDAARNINQEIQRIKKLAPSPSDAQKTAIKVLENERDALLVSRPNAEQLINQHINYNSDMKSIYAKPEFSGKEEEVRKSYEFLKDQLVKTMSKQGSPDVANAFKAANKIYHEKSKLDQTERILEKAFKDGYNPKKLNKIINSRDGKFLKRNIGKDAVKDIEDIATYGQVAQEKMNRFLDLRSPSILNEVRSWGEIAPFFFLPKNLVGGSLAIARTFGKHLQGKLLTRDALRKKYKVTLKHAAEGQFNLLKKDFANLEREISKQYGSVSDFVDKTLEDLPMEE